MTGKARDGACAEGLGRTGKHMLSLRCLAFDLSGCKFAAFLRRNSHNEDHKDVMKSRSLIAAFLVCSAPVPLTAQIASPVQPNRWAQDETGRKADPAVRFGTLPNGLRYAIMHNETPSDGVAMRMRIGSGSIQEQDDEQGLAHFIEHMAFRGSANVADGDVVRMLQRQGLQFGPDTNASTAQDETVYMFNFPKANAEALDTGLTLFREIGDRLKLAPAAIEAERGVILSEERLRDTPPFRVAKAEVGTAFDGTRAVNRWPIGKTDVIKTADHDRFERYYRANTVRTMRPSSSLGMSIPRS